MPHFSNDGVRLHYETHGSGPPVVMLHGAGVTFTGNFAACGWVDRLTGRGLQVIGLDFRGHGASEKPPDSAAYGTEIFSRDVVALLDHLGIETSGLVGYSIGSTIALHLLHAFPRRFVNAALIATGDGLIGFPPYTFPAILPPLISALAREEYPSDLPPQLAVYWTMATTIAGDRAGVAAAASGSYPPCTEEEAAAVDAPVLVVSGDRDSVLGTGARLAKALPRGRYLELAGADHFSLAIDETVQFAVADFLLEGSA